MEEVIRIKDAMCHYCDRRFDLLNQDENGEQMCDNCMLAMCEEIDLPWLKKKRYNRENGSVWIDIMRKCKHESCEKLVGQTPSYCWDCESPWWDFQCHYEADITCDHFYSKRFIWKLYRCYLVYLRWVRLPVKLIKWHIGNFFKWKVVYKYKCWRYPDEYHDEVPF